MQINTNNERGTKMAETMTASRWIVALTCGVAFAGVGTATNADAAIVMSFTEANKGTYLGTQIDPPGEQSISKFATGSADKATLEALPSFAVIQNWQLWGTTSGAQTRIATFDSSFTALLPDIRFDHNQTVNTNTEPERRTSSTNALQFSVYKPSHTFQIDFGTWNNSTTTFTPDGLLGGVGFVITRVSGINYTVVFRDAVGNALSTQTTSGSSKQQLYFAHIDQTTGIRSAHISTDSDVSIVPGFDDFGFAPIPEPSTLALLSLGGLALLRRRR